MKSPQYCSRISFLSYEWTHPRCSVLSHLCPRLLLFDRLNCRPPTKILKQMKTYVPWHYYKFTCWWSSDLYQPILPFTYILCYPYRSVHIPKALVENIHRVGSYHLEKCHNRRSRGCSLSIRSPQLQTDTTPAKAHDTHVQHAAAASYSRSQL